MWGQRAHEEEAKHEIGGGSLHFYSPSASSLSKLQCLASTTVEEIAGVTYTTNIALIHVSLRNAHSDGYAVRLLSILN